MKRLYIVLTVVLSSFLLLSGREVKAYEYTADFSLINDDFNTIKNNIENLLSSDTIYSDYYIIYYYTGAFNAYVFPNDYNFSFLIFNYYPGYIQVFDDMMYSNFNKLIINSDLSVSFKSTNTKLNFMTFTGSSSIIYYNCPSFTARGSDTITVNYNEKSWIFSKDDGAFSLYDLYIDYYGEPEEPVDNTPILTDFYTTVIEKINYLCGVLVSNYIYLSIFVIILIIILFELIFRRYL